MLPELKLMSDLLLLVLPSARLLVTFVSGMAFCLPSVLASQSANYFAALNPWAPTVELYFLLRQGYVQICHSRKFQ